jgi:hypothetical protein
MKVKVPQVKINSAYYIISCVALAIFTFVLIFVPSSTWRKLFSGNFNKFATAFQATTTGNWNNTATWGLYDGLTPLNNPQGIAISSSTGEIYIADYSNNRIVVLNPDGTASTTYTGYNFPLDLFLSSSGYIYIADSSNNRIVVLNPDGSASTTYSLGFYTTGVALSPAGYIYVGDGDNNRIVVLNPDGSASTTYSLFDYPAALFIPPTSDIYIVDTNNNQIVVLNPDGSASTTYSSGLNNPSDITLSPTGYIYIADSSNNRIVVLNPDGSASTTYSLGFYTSSVALSPAGYIYVGDGDNNRIVVLNPDGSASTTYDGTQLPNTFVGTEGIDYPGINDDVTISTGTTTLTQDQNVRNITLATGGTLDLNGFTLNVAGSLNNTGGTLIYNGGSINFVNPLPTTSSISPTSTIAGDPDFSLTVNGTNFIGSSTVQFNGSARTTTFISSTTLTATILSTDIVTGATSSITVFNPTPGGGTSSSQTLTIYNPAPFPTFSSVANYSVGSVPQYVASADFNNDNKTDLVVVRSDNTALILLGDGSGGFSASTTFSVDPPNFVLADDFNHDDNPDFVTTSFTNNTITIFLGDGSGGFPASTTISVGTNPQAAFAADFNGDNNLDLAVANLVSVNISILLGDGSGGFGAATNFYIGRSLRSIFSADFNNDGKLDLVTGNQDFPGSVSVLLGDGSGGFGAVTNFSVGNNPFSVIATDFNNDGKQDLAVNNTADSNASILLGDGSGGFGAPTNFGVGSLPYIIFSADFNNDNNKDLAVANQGSSDVSVLLGDGSGGLGTATNLSLGNSPFDVIATDLNNDSRQDLVLTSAGSAFIDILLNENLGLALRSISPTSKTAGAAQFSLTLTGSGFTSSSIVKFNGSPRTTTFISSTTVTAIIPSTDLTSVGTSSITVFNTTPGGGTSNLKAFVVSTATGGRRPPVGGTGGNTLDTTAPVITILGPNPAIITVGTTYIDPGATAFDDVDGTTTVRVESNNVNTNAIGTYAIVYSATDLSGNTAASSRLVYVTAANTPPPTPTPTPSTSPTPLPANFCFTKNLYPYTSDTDVRYLQIFLNNQGFASTPVGYENNYYGPETRNAVISFQNYYAKDILIDPYGLTSGTGNFGNYTRKKSNDILGCPTTFEAAPVTPPQPTPQPTPPPQVIPVIPTSTTTAPAPAASTTPEPTPVTPAEPTPTKSFTSNIVESFAQSYNRALVILGNGMTTITDFIKGKDITPTLIAIALGALLAIIIILYGITRIFKSFRNKKPGTIKDKSTNLPLSSARVKVFKEGMPTMPVAIKITDTNGKYNIPVPKGNYYIEIEKKNLDGTFAQVFKSSVVHIEKGIINEDLVV